MGARVTDDGKEMRHLRRKTTKERLERMNQTTGRSEELMQRAVDVVIRILIPMHLVQTSCSLRDEQQRLQHVDSCDGTDE